MAVLQQKIIIFQQKIIIFQGQVSIISAFSIEILETVGIYIAIRYGRNPLGDFDTLNVKFIIFNTQIHQFEHTFINFNTQIHRFKHTHKSFSIHKFINLNTKS